MNPDDFPPNVTRLAQACLVQNVTAQQVMHQAPEDSLEFARQAGFDSWDEFLSAVDWLSDFYLARSTPPS